MLHVGHRAEDRLGIHGVAIFQFARFCCEFFAKFVVQRSVDEESARGSTDLPGIKKACEDGTLYSRIHVGVGKYDKAFFPPSSSPNCLTCALARS